MRRRLAILVFVFCAVFVGSSQLSAWANGTSKLQSGHVDTGAFCTWGSQGLHHATQRSGDNPPENWHTAQSAGEDDTVCGSHSYHTPIFWSTTQSVLWKQVGGICAIYPESALTAAPALSTFSVVWGDNAPPCGNRSYGTAVVHKAVVYGTNESWVSSTSWLYIHNL